jgi:hypothetical protein
MKILISENKLKNLIRNRFGIDLTGKISMITSQYQLPMSFDSIISPTELNRILNHRGPCYLLKIGRNEYLLTPMENKDWLIITDNEWLRPFEFMRELGIEMLGLSIDDLLEMYFDEKESINEMYNPDDEPNYKMIEKLINKVMSKKFDWWKGLTIYDFKIRQPQTSEHYYFIDGGKLRVDRDWGASQWRKYHYSFPDNTQWEEPDGRHTYFGDIIGGEEAEEIKQRLLMVLNAFYGKTFKELTFTAIKLKFE